MIRTEKEYQEARKRLEAEHQQIVEQKKILKSMKLNEDEIKRAVDPMESFYLQLAEEVQSYEKIKRGDLGESHNLHGLGQKLVALRICLGLSQKELADRLSVNESQVSRDEKNEYYGISIERASKILDALNVDLESKFKSPLLTPEPKKAGRAVG